MSIFHLGDILSVTHQLPRASDECLPAVLAQHPDLADVKIPRERFRVGGEAEVWRWLAEQVERYGAHREVQPLAREDHTRIDPIAELRMLRPDAPIIVITPGDDV